MIRIDRPVEEVFAFVTDAENHPRWDESSVSMQLGGWWRGRGEAWAGSGRSPGG